MYKLVLFCTILSCFFQSISYSQPYRNVIKKDIELHFHSSMYDHSEFEILLKGQLAFLEEYVERKFETNALPRKKIIINTYSLKYSHPYLSIISKDDYYIEYSSLAGELDIRKTIASINFLSSGQPKFESRSYKSNPTDSIFQEIDSFVKANYPELKKQEYVIWEKSKWKYSYRTENDYVSVYYNNEEYPWFPYMYPIKVKKGMLLIGEEGSRVEEEPGLLGTTCKYDTRPNGVVINEEKDRIVISDKQTNKCLCIFSRRGNTLEKCD